MDAAPAGRRDTVAARSGAVAAERRARVGDHKDGTAPPRAVAPSIGNIRCACPYDGTPRTHHTRVSGRRVARGGTSDCAGLDACPGISQPREWCGPSPNRRPRVRERAAGTWERAPAIVRSIVRFAPLASESVDVRAPERFSTESFVPAARVLRAVATVVAASSVVRGATLRDVRPKGGTGATSIFRTGLIPASARLRRLDAPPTTCTSANNRLRRARRGRPLLVVSRAVQ